MNTPADSESEQNAVPSEDAATGAENGTSADDEAYTTPLVNQTVGGQKQDVTATTIARMMGVATNTDLKLIEGKVDLLSGRLHNLGVRIERIITVIDSLPSGADFERIDAQLAALRTLVKETVASLAPANEVDEPDDRGRIQEFMEKQAQRGGSDSGEESEGGDAEGAE